MSRLPALGKRVRVTQQLLPIITYGCELYPEPSEQQCRLAAEIHRWVVGAYRGSSTRKVEALTRISDLRSLMRNRRIRWATSVYGRHLPELTAKAAQILGEVLEEDAELRWMSGEYPEGRGVVRV